MNRLVRFLILSLGIMVLGSLTGCGNSSETVQPAEASQQPTSDHPAENEKEPTLPEEGP